MGHSVVRLFELQASFQRYLLGDDPSRALSARIQGNGIAVDRRLAVYRNNVTHALIEALAAIYPVIKRLVGEAFFQSLAREFVRAYPPTRGTLIGYGAGFGEFLDALPSAPRLPYLGDVARLEFAWLTAYHAPDAAPLAAGDLAKLPQEALAALRLALHPSTQLLITRHPVREIWEVNRQPGPVPRLRLGEGPEYSLVLRPHLDVRVVPLSAGGHTLLRALAHGDSLTGAFQQALASEPEMDLQTHLQNYLMGGVFAGWSEPPAPGAEQA